FKKEIADRYFGFRKVIEDDTQDYEDQVRQYSYVLEKRISFDLIRLYILLKDSALIHLFCEEAGLEEKLFYDDELTNSQAIMLRVFQGVRFHGFTKAGRFKNFGLDCYKRLAEHVDQYGKKIEALRDVQETISEEIKLFYRKNDINAILSFMRSMGNPDLSSHLAGGMEVGMAESLEKKLEIKPPFPIEQYLPVIPNLKSPDRIHKELLRLIKQAYSGQDDQILNIFSQKVPFPHRKDDR
ncbi:MAG: hypothetical protein JRF02_00835, partial [Deltaproteobacteria bacterium]|nr:hypothetical protein [Deltaproteobacteria bacterium]